MCWLRNHLLEKFRSFNRLHCLRIKVSRYVGEQQHSLEERWHFCQVCWWQRDAPSGQVRQTKTSHSCQQFLSPPHFLQLRLPDEMNASAASVGESSGAQKHQYGRLYFMTCDQPNKQPAHCACTKHRWVIDLFLCELLQGHLLPLSGLRVNYYTLQCSCLCGS